MTDTEQGRKALEAACDAYRSQSYSDFHPSVHGMRVAIKAWLANLPGWRMVPVDLTAPMREACQEADDSCAVHNMGYSTTATYDEHWTHCLDKAPPPPGLEDSSE